MGPKVDIFNETRGAVFVATKADISTRLSRYSKLKPCLLLTLTKGCLFLTLLN